MFSIFRLTLQLYCHIIISVNIWTCITRRHCVKPPFNKYNLGYRLQSECINEPHDAEKLKSGCWLRWYLWKYIFKENTLIENKTCNHAGRNKTPRYGRKLFYSCSVVRIFKYLYLTCVLLFIFSNVKRQIRLVVYVYFIWIW